MAQITKGIRSILSNPAVYNFLQFILGVNKLRKILVNQYFSLHDGIKILDIGCAAQQKYLII